jgi:Integron Cassette Protein Hfx_Cass5
MKQEIISNVAISDSGVLLLKLESLGNADYQYVYRAGSGVSWDSELNCFKSNLRKEWAYSKWFFHILDAVQSELGIKLMLAKLATWNNVSEEVKAEILETFE